LAIQVVGSVLYGLLGGIVGLAAGLVAGSSWHVVCMWAVIYAEWWLSSLFL